LNASTVSDSRVGAIILVPYRTFTIEERLEASHVEIEINLHELVNVDLILDRYLGLEIRLYLD
jgi:hypothetical protein